MTEPDGQDERERQQAVRLTVAQDGSGDYDTVGAALAALGDKDGPPACIFIKEGVYRERLEITRPWITLEGQSAGSTVITSGLSAGMAMEDGSKRGTFRTYSVLVDTHDFTARNLTIENSAGPGKQWDRHWPCMRTGTGFCLKDAGCWEARTHSLQAPYLRRRYKRTDSSDQNSFRPG